MHVHVARSAQRKLPAHVCLHSLLRPQSGARARSLYEAPDVSASSRPQGYFHYLLQGRFLSHHVFRYDLSFECVLTLYEDHIQQDYPKLVPVYYQLLESLVQEHLSTYVANLSSSVLLFLFARISEGMTNNDNFISSSWFFFRLHFIHYRLLKIKNNLMLYLILSSVCETKISRELEYALSFNCRFKRSL